MSGLSIISQLSFIKNSFSSPTIGTEQPINKANSQKSVEQMSLIKEESLNDTPTTGLRRTQTHQNSRTELRKRKVNIHEEIKRERDEIVYKYVQEPLKGIKLSS